MMSCKELSDMTKTIEILRSKAQSTKQHVTSDTDEIIRLVTEKLKNFDTNFTQLKTSTNELSEDFKQVSSNVESLNCVLKDLMVNIKDKIKMNSSGSSSDDDDDDDKDSLLSSNGSSLTVDDSTSRLSFVDDSSDDSSFEIIDSREANDVSFTFTHNRKQVKSHPNDDITYKALMDILVKNVINASKSSRQVSTVNAR